MNGHPTLKAVFKYKKHPSIISIRRFYHQVSNFNFSCIDKNTVLKEIRCLKVVSTTFLLVHFLSLNESTCQSRKNVFYFTSKAGFVFVKVRF